MFEPKPDKNNSNQMVWSFASFTFLLNKWKKQSMKIKKSIFAEQKISLSPIYSTGKLFSFFMDTALHQRKVLNHLSKFFVSQILLFATFQ